MYIFFFILIEVYNEILKYNFYYITWELLLDVRNLQEFINFNSDKFSEMKIQFIVNKIIPETQKIILYTNYASKLFSF